MKNRQNKEAMSNQWEAFFKAIYDGTGHNLELRALPSRKQLFTKWDNAGQIEGFIKDNINQNLYFGVCTREGQKGDKEATREVPALWVDIDFKDFQGGEEEAREFLEKTLHIATSAAVHTGNGVHLYWFLKEPEEARPEIEAYLKGLAKKLKGDIKAAELARILRIPDTFNRKDGGEKPVRLVKLNTELRYNLSDFEDFKDDTPVTDAAVHTVNVQEITDKCTFLKHCHENRTSLLEPLWYAMVSNVCRISPGGPDLVNAMSQGHPGYSRSETDQKILHALNGAGPHSCQYIKETWDCGKNCGVKAPIALLNGKVNVEVKGLEREKEGPEEFDPSKLPTGAHIQTLEVKIEWLIKGLLPKKAITVLHGRGGIGKTWLSLSMAEGISTGKPFLGLDTAQTPVYYIDYENPLPVLVERVKTLKIQGVYFWHISNVTPPPALDTEWNHLYGKLPEGSLIVFDTFRSAHTGDENDSKNISNVLMILKLLREKGYTILLLHHTAKGNDSKYKGSTAILDLADHELNLCHADKKEGEEDSFYKLHTPQKSRYQTEELTLDFDLDQGGFFVLPNQAEETQKRIYKFILELPEEQRKKTALVEQLKDTLGIGRNKIRKLLDNGTGIFWTTTNTERRSIVYHPIPDCLPDLDIDSLMEGEENSICQSATPYIGRQTGTLDIAPSEPIGKLTTENHPQNLINTEFASLPEGIRQIGSLDLFEGII